MTGWLFEPLYCLADFPCESKLSQIKSSPHRNLSGLPVILAKTPFATLIEKQCCTQPSLNSCLAFVNTFMIIRVKG